MSSAGKAQNRTVGGDRQARIHAKRNDRTCTAASRTIPPPRRWRYRSTRRSPMRSTAPTMARRCSTSRPKATATAASATRPPPCWRSASPPSKAASAPWRSAPGQSALYYAIANLADGGGNIVSVPQLYGTTHTLFAHMLPAPGHRGVASPKRTAPTTIERLIDADTRAVFCESVGNPAGNICDIEALAEVAHRHGVPLVVDNTVATPILMRPIDYGADIVVQSLTKFMGGHGTTLGGAVIDAGRFPWRDYADRFPMFCVAGRILSRARLRRSLRRPRPMWRAAGASTSARPARCCRR